MNNITAFVLTQNNETTLQKCLESVTWCDHVVIIDSFSQDRTLEIIHGFPDIAIYQHEYTTAREQRIWGMQHVQSKWVFIIDSDEFCTAALAIKLRELVNQDADVCDGYLIFTRTVFLNKLLTHQDYLSSYGKRLVHTQIATRYWKDVRVHASIRLDHKKFLPRQFYLVHDPIRNFSRQFTKMARYAQWQAADLSDKGVTVKWWHFVLRPAAKFVKHYLIKGGWKDGLPGLIIDLLGAWSVFLKFLFLKELQSHDKTS